MFTEQDVRDALYTAQVDSDMQAQECSLRAAILAYTFAERGSAEEQAEYENGLATYERGKTILKRARLVQSRRDVRGAAGDNPATIKGDWQDVAIREPSGHIGTMEAVRWYGLEPREEQEAANGPT